jgi:hypothetical protein
MPDSIVLTDATIKEFQEFVEWLLEMHLSDAREAELHQKMIAWDEDDQRSKELVGEYVSAFREIEIQNSDVGLQESWRKENQPILLGLLREEMPHNQVASLLIEEHESAHRTSEAPASSSSEVLVVAGVGLLGLLGAALLSNVIKKYREQPSPPNQGTMRGNVLSEMREIKKSQQAEEEELEKVSPELYALQQRMQNQQLRVQMLTNINRMLAGRKI